MRKELEKVSYQHEGKTIFNLWSVLYILQDVHKVNFWDYCNSDADFDNWCNLKGYGKKDSEGKARRASNIWFKEYQEDISNGVFKKNLYCPFIDMFMEDIQDLGNDDTDEVYEVSLNSMMDRSIKEDEKEFGKNDYRVHLTTILINELGNSVFVNQSPE